MVSITKSVRRYLQYKLTASANGYYDKVITKVFTENNPTVELNDLVPYDGLNYTVDLSKNSIRKGEINFTETELPYTGTKSRLINKNYCFGEEGVYHDLPIYEYIYDNIIIQGNLTLINNTASNFNASNYIKIPKSRIDGNETYIIKFQCTNFNNINTIVCCENYLDVEVSSSGVLYAYNWGMGTSTTLISSLELNKWYYLKIVISNKTERSYYTSTDGITWSEAITRSDTGINFDDSSYKFVYIGEHTKYTTNARKLTGSLDMEESLYIVNSSEYKLNKQTYSPIIITIKQQGNVYVNGTTVSNISGSTSKVILSNVRFNKDENIFVLFTTGSNISSVQGIFDSSVSFFIRNGYCVFWDSITNAWHNIFEVKANTGYRIKLVITSSSSFSIGYALIDEHTYDYMYISDWPYELFGSVDAGIGNYKRDSASAPFYGSVDFGNIPFEKTVKTEPVLGIYDPDYTDTGATKTLNCFSNGNNNVVLSEKENYKNYRYLGTVNIPKHKVF